MVLRKFLHDWIHLSIVPNGVGTFEYAVGDSIVPHPVMTAQVELCIHWVTFVARDTDSDSVHGTYDGGSGYCCY